MSEQNRVVVLELRIKMDGEEYLNVKKRSVKYHSERLKRCCDYELRQICCKLLEVSDAFDLVPK